MNPRTPPSPAKSQISDFRLQISNPLRRPLAWCVLLALWPLAAFSAAPEFFFLNPTSEPSGVPARMASASLGVDDGSYALQGAKGAVDVAGGQAVILAEAGPMSAVKCAVGPAAPPLAIKEGDVLEIKTAACIYRIGPGYLEASAGPKSARLALGKGFLPVVSRRGAASAVIGSAEKGSAQRIEVCATGLVRLEGFKALAFEGTDGARPIQSRKMELGVSKPAGGQALVFPEDWMRFDGGAKTLGLGVFPDYGSTLKAKEASLTLDGGTLSAWVAPASNDDEARRLRARTQPALALVKADAETFSGQCEAGGKSAHLVVRDRNRNGIPDTEGDLWLWSADAQAKPGLALAFSKSPDASSGTRLCIFKTGGTDLAKTMLDENPAARAAPPAGQTALKPEIIVEDWNRDGTFVSGGVIFGGFLGADRISKDGTQWAQCWDLNGDKYCDVFEYSPGHYIFNFKQEIPSLIGLEFDPLAGAAAIRITKGYSIQEHASMFSKSCDPAGRTFKGAVQAFEEHFFADMKPGESPLWKNGAAFFYYLIGGGDVNRLSMGRLDGSSALRDWDIEFDPVPEPGSAAEWNIASLKDAAGHELKLHTISVPEDWKGGKADIKQFYKGWYDMADGKYKTKALYACFAPPGSVCPSSEGMYGGALTTQERIEVDERGGTYVLYYSPLLGGLHLKGADFGAYAVPAGTPDFFLDVNRYYHREAHTGETRFVGAQPVVTWRQREAKRLIGPVFLSYSDEDGDGFFDRYIYDIDNDGIYERILSYDAKAGVVSLTDKNFTAAWPQTFAFDEVRYLPENYDAVSALYKKGTGQPPLVASMQIGSSGTPVNLVTSPYYKETIPPFFNAFGREWRTVVAADKVHGGALDPWVDFGPSGVSRIGSMFAKRCIVQESLDRPWSDESLADIDVLLVPSLALTPSEDEVKALKRWMENGGVAILSTVEDEAARTRFAATGKMLGFQPAATALDKRTPIYMWKGLGGIGPQARAAETRTPAPWNEVKHFEDPQKRGLLDGFEYLSFSGYPLENLGEGLKPLLGYDGKTLMASAPVGKGLLVVSGVDLWTNRYIWHHEFYEGGTQNDQLVDRLVGFAAAPLPLLKVSAITCTPEKISIKVFGKGGTLKFSRRYDAMSTDLACIGNRTELAKKRFALAGASVNSTPAKITEVGTLEEIQLPPGESTVEISYAEIQQ